MKGYFRRRGCTCPRDKNGKVKKCTCGAKWSYTLDLGKHADGTRNQKSRSGFDTKEEAVKDASKLYNEYVEGNYIEESKIDFKQFADNWLELYARENKPKSSTLATRGMEVKRLNKLFPKIKIKDITRLKYQNALNTLQDQGLSKGTIGGTHAVGRMIFKKAVELGLIKQDPTEFAKLPKYRKTVEEIESEADLPKFLEKDDLNTLLNIADESKLVLDREIFHVLAYSGLRIGELLALKWSDLNTKEHTITITKTLWRKGKLTEYKLQTPKTKSSKRIVEVEPFLFDMLDRWKARQNQIRMKHRSRYHEENFIFTSWDRFPGYPMAANDVLWRMRRLLDLASLDKSLSTHSLRHTHASLLAEAGVGLEEIQERLGHSDDHITRKIYLHVTEEKRKEAVRKFGLLMRGET